MYDTIVIGGGPAGLTAALYTVRKEMKTILVSPDIGGQMLLTNEIENYPGFESVAGYELADKMEAQVRKYPVTIEYASVEKFRKGKDGTFTVSLDDGQELHGRTLIVTAGKRNRTLDIDGEARLTGRGVSYCATCDAPFYRNKVTAVVGGGDSAVQAAMELAAIGTKVYLLVRSRIRASEILVNRLNKLPNVEVMIGYSPVRITGDKKVDGVDIRNNSSGEESHIEVDGLFVEAGGIPNNAYLPEEVAVNGKGEILTDKDGLTNVPGLFAAGDVTDREAKQGVIAAGEGAAAALSAHAFLLRNE